MNKLFMYLVGIGVLIMVMVVGWELLQLSSGIKSSVNQPVIPMERNTVFTNPLKEYLTQKKLSRSGLTDTERIGDTEEQTTQESILTPQ